MSVLIKKKLTMAVLLVFLLVGCNQPSNGEQPSVDNTVKVSVVAVEKQSPSTEIKSIGEMRPVKEMLVSPLVDTTVKTVDCVLGQKVAAGDVLFTMDDTELRQELALQRDYLSIAEANLQRAQARGEPVEIPEIQVRIAKRNYDKAAKNLAKCTVVAPIAGTVVLYDVEIGAPARLTGAMVSDVTKGLITTYVSSDIIGSISTDSKVEVSIPSLVESIQGKVVEANAYYYLEKSGYPIEIEVNLVGQDILPYGFVEVEISGSFSEQVLVIPEKAVLHEGKETYAYVLNKDNTVSQRMIQLGYATDDAVVVLFGLSEGEKVVVTGTRLLKDGMTVVVE